MENERIESGRGCSFVVVVVVSLMGGFATERHMIVGIVRKKNNPNDMTGARKHVFSLKFLNSRASRLRDVFAGFKILPSKTTTASLLHRPTSVYIIFCLRSDFLNYCHGVCRRLD
jgi:hypothetical protein